MEAQGQEALAEQGPVAQAAAEHTEIPEEVTLAKPEAPGGTAAMAGELEEGQAQHQVAAAGLSTLTAAPEAQVHQEQIGPRHQAPDQVAAEREAGAADTELQPLTRLAQVVVPLELTAQAEAAVAPPVAAAVAAAVARKE